MASILDRYGIKEVADVTFYRIDKEGNPAEPVLYLDTLKVSTIEQTAEEAEATGGKGNPPLIIWDYGKDITVTLEDALFSAKSMAIMFGNSVVENDVSKIEGGKLRRTVQFTYNSDEDLAIVYHGPRGRDFTIESASISYYTAAGASISSGYVKGETYFATFDMPITEGGMIEISAANFPGTYYVTGDTFARSEKNGEDEFFQFIIPKAKVQSENTITLEAEGDPSVFNMNLRVMRPADGIMMKLIKYDMEDDKQKEEKTSSLSSGYSYS